MLGEVVASNHVQDAIDAVRLGPAGQLGGPVLGAVVNSDLRAEAAAKTAFFIRAGGGGDPGAESAGNLNSQSANPARAALYQEQVAAKEPAGLKKIRPHSNGSLRDGCRVAQRSTGRDGHALAFGRHPLLAVASSGEQGANRVANSPAAGCDGAELGNVPGDLHSQNGRSAKWRWIVSLALQQIGAIDPCRLYPDEHFSRTRQGNRPGGEPKHLWSARFRDLDIAHGFRCSCHTLSGCKWISISLVEISFFDRPILEQPLKKISYQGVSDQSRRACPELVEGDG